MVLVRKGFTLVELIVVVLIVGVLASVSVAYYTRTVENSKAQDAIAIGHMLAVAHRMYLLDTPGAPLQGAITEANCPSTTACSSATGSCKLVACGYMAPHKWSSSAYSFSAGDGTALAIVSRKTGATPGTDRSPYSSWGYRFDESGGCAPVNNAPSCPSF